MLSRVADGVFVHVSEFVQTNTVVVQGDDGVLLVDPGIHAEELACLEKDLADAGRVVVAGFSTHPHWDHLLWTTGLGDARRHATARGAETARAKLAGGLDPERAKAVGVPDDVPLDLIGTVTGLPPGATRVPWGGPEVRIIEHDAHAAGHAALLVVGPGVLVAGDMLSDVLVPMLDMGAADPVEDYLDALTLFDGVAGDVDVDVVVPGHGSVGGADQLRTRVDQDRTYLGALRDGRASDDPRVGPAARPGWEWVAGVHEGQVRQLAQRREDQREDQR
jgi:glyoxylase-like metal-dependent hydrolase (beta-lactamase superfamily II)